MRTIKKMERAFSLYEGLKARSDMYLQNRNKGRRGIGVDDDHNAKEWRKLEFRIHFLTCYLKGEKINWHYASWLSYDEAVIRNNQSRQVDY